MLPEEIGQRLLEQLLKILEIGKRRMLATSFTPASAQGIRIQLSRLRAGAGFVILLQSCIHLPVTDPTDHRTGAEFRRRVNYWTGPP